MTQDNCVSDSIESSLENPAVEQGDKAVGTGGSSMDATPAGPTSGVRRSVRAGRGTTSRYDNFVRD